MFFIFFFKQKTAYEMRISDWSSDVCSSDLPPPALLLTSRFDRPTRSPMRAVPIVSTAVYPRTCIRIASLRSHATSSVSPLEMQHAASRTRGQRVRFEFDDDIAIDDLDRFAFAPDIADLQHAAVVDQVDDVRCELGAAAAGTPTRPPAAP